MNNVFAAIACLALPCGVLLAGLQRVPSQHDSAIGSQAHVSHFSKKAAIVRQSADDSGRAVNEASVVFVEPLAVPVAMAVDSDGDGIQNDADNCPFTPNPLQEDCDEDGVGDACALDLGADTDCNGNGFPDRCDVIYFSSFDCNFNLVPDECESDCDGDGLIDDCDSEPDVDGNGVPDNCDPDCNENGVPDGFEIDNGFAEDCDGNGVIDTCELMAFRLESLIEGPAVESGRSVAIDGDVAVVGSPAVLGSGDEGTAEVYRFDGSDWVLETTLGTPGPAEVTEVFGGAVDIDNDRLIVGAGRLHWNSSGSAFVFRFDGNQWWPEAWLTPFGGSSDGRFGVSVAIDDGRAIVGAGGYDALSSAPGRIFSYELEDSQWVGIDSAQAPQFPWRQDFGYAVALHGERVLASAGGDPAFAPRAFGFEVDPKGSLQHEATLQTGAAPGSEVSINLSSSWAAVGGPQSVGIYDADWLGVDSITTSGGDFGAALALSDDLLAISRHDQDGTNVMQLMRFDGAWSYLTDLLVDAAVRVAQISGSTMAVGSPATGDEGLTRIYREADCDLNGTMDVCEIAEDPSLDCNADGLLDICGIEDGLHEDCNGNGVPDECDVADPDMDLNGNGIPDECECLADLSGATICTPDGIVGTDDILAVIGFWDTTSSCGDANLDGIVGTDDILTIISNWGPCAGFRHAPLLETKPTVVPLPSGPQKPDGQSAAVIGRVK